MHLLELAGRPGAGRQAWSLQAGPAAALARRGRCAGQWGHLQLQLRLLQLAAHVGRGRRLRRGGALRGGRRLVAAHGGGGLRRGQVGAEPALVRAQGLQAAGLSSLHGICMPGTAPESATRNST